MATEPPGLQQQATAFVRALVDNGGMRLIGRCLAYVSFACAVWLPLLRSFWWLLSYLSCIRQMTWSESVLALGLVWLWFSIAARLYWLFPAVSTSGFRAWRRVVRAVREVRSTTDASRSQVPAAAEVHHRKEAPEYPERRRPRRVAVLRVDSHRPLQPETAPGELG